VCAPLPPGQIGRYAACLKSVRHPVELRVIKGEQLIDSGLGERILEFDKKNMGPLLEKAGLEFPEERRRKGSESNPTFIIAFDNEDILGYLEYLRSWNDPNYIYVGSIQIAETKRNTRLILELIDKFRGLVAGEEFIGFEANVQKANSLAVKMYRKLGFSLEQNPHNDRSWVAKADRKILQESPVITLIDRWRKKMSAKGGA
jgi:hypothetical protein